MGKDEKTWRNLYLLSLKTSLWKRSRTFFPAVYPNKNHESLGPYFHEEFMNIYNIFMFKDFFGLSKRKASLRP